jgi:crossover junction endodeoxyribonuclease RuvC
MDPHMSLHILGVDPSLTGTGLALIRPDDAVPIRTKLVRTKPAEGYLATLDRIRGIARDVIEFSREYAEQGDEIHARMEAPIFGSVRDKSGNVVASAGQAHTRAGLWWLLAHLLEKEADVFDTVEPTVLKKYVTGRGNAPKAEVLARIVAMFPTLGIFDDNEADGLGLALMKARDLGIPMEPSGMIGKPGALEGVEWPDYTNTQRS